MSGFLWKFGFTAYLTLYPSYLVKESGFTTEQAAIQTTIFGATCIAGALTMIIVTRFCSINSLLLYTCLPLVFGPLMLAMIVATSEVSAFFYQWWTIIDKGQIVNIKPKEITRQSLSSMLIFYRFLAKCMAWNTWKITPSFITLRKYIKIIVKKDYRKYINFAYHAQ